VLVSLVRKAVACSRLAPSLVGEGSLAWDNLPALTGTGWAMTNLYKEIGMAAAASMSVLIRGETGVGKELVANTIHSHISRAKGPFIAVNCAAMPETLLESELFGYERGAFTGAEARRLGRFEQAFGGTIFLDEIGDLTPPMQVKLLRVLQEKKFQRLGSNETIQVGARVLAATHQDLQRAVTQARFRKDLFFRLSGLTIHVPPLRDRLEDLPELLKYFLRRSGLEIGVALPSILSEAIDFFGCQDWPGNVRQLESVVRHSLLLARDQPIPFAHAQTAYDASWLPPLLKDPTIGSYITGLLAQANAGQIRDTRDRMIKEMDRRLFAQALESAHGNQAKAASLLGVTRTTMRQKLRNLGPRTGTTAHD